LNRRSATPPSRHSRRPSIPAASLAPERRDALIERVRDSVPRGARVTVGLSGGVDSMVLLDLLWRARESSAIELRALHVHHGLSPNADRWASFCRRAAARRAIPLQVVKVDLAPFRDRGLEGAAREARYRAFAQAGPGWLALAHHADDQAETLLLQLLRGAGPAGLAGMRDRRPLAVPGGGSIDVVRPLLEVRRAEILSYARARRLRWVEDESNADTSRLRNAVRLEILPRLERWNAGAVDNINRSARLVAEAAVLVRELTDGDLEAVLGERGIDGGLEWTAVVRLGEARAVNALRLYLERRGLPALSAAQTRELWSQLTRGRPDAQLEFAVHGFVVRRYRDRVICERESGALPRAAGDCAWDGANPWRIDRLGGEILFRPVSGGGIRSQLLGGGHRVEVGDRRETRSFRPLGSAHRRALKKLFQEACIPSWHRRRLPFLYIDAVLSWIPGIGVGDEFAAAAGEPGLQPEWVPDFAAALESPWNNVLK
jgi:tRNA(Ile)-lysidine synthase